MKRILFIDDEPRILEGIRALLRKSRYRWDMTFAPGPEHALAMRRSPTSIPALITNVARYRGDGVSGQVVFGGLRRM